MSDSTSKPGQPELPRPFGNYSLLKLLARGGMGEIYLARTAGITGFEKYYAVKKLLKKFTHDNDVGARFVDEAKLGARLQHPNIVQVYDLGRVSDELYMATEFVDGFDLRRVLRFCHEKKKRIPLDIALFIVREVLSGLAYAHRQVDAEGQSINLIHRDISPQNVLVSFEGEVKIIDFGLAKSTQRSQETQANVLLGNFGYMSPEQARGQILDVRTDVYSCGIVLFELVTGTKRFVEENPLKLLEMVARPTPIMPSDRVPSAPKAVDRIYGRATSQDKEQRYASAEAFRDDVTTALHRLNPRASRENLAQFLNHLFLGGQAPPSVDNDVLNKSVVLVARELHADMESLSTGSANPAEDLKNRALGQNFGEDAPQTASHTLLRSARVGDVLSHEAITGDAALPAPMLPGLPNTAPFAGPFPNTAPNTAPHTALNTALNTAPIVAPSTAVAAPPADPQSLDGADIISLDEMPLADSAFEAVGLTAQITNEVRTEEPPSSSQDGAVLAESDEAHSDGQGPTRVYDSPSWPGGDDATRAGGPPPTRPGPMSADEAARREVQRQLEAQAQLDVQRQLEQQAAQAEVRRQLEAQMQAQLEGQLQAQMQAQMQAQGAEQARQQELARQAEQQRQAALLAQREEQARQQAQARLLEQQARQQALAQQLDEAQAAQVTSPSMTTQPRAAPTSSRRIQGLTGATATETAMPAVNIAVPSPPTNTPSATVAKPRRVQQDSQPSIVISADLEAEVIEEGATMRNPRAQGGFGEGGAHESLVIDFGSGEPGSSDDEFPIDLDSGSTPIRPAARPMGKPVVPSIAAARPRRASDEGPPTTMPPPTRRR